MELLGQNPGFTFKLLGKNLNREGPSRLVVIINIIFIYCCARELLYAKMLKKLKVKKQSALLLSFLSLVAFQLGGGGPSGHAYFTQSGRSTPFKLLSGPTRRGFRGTSCRARGIRRSYKNTRYVFCKTSQ